MKKFFSTILCIAACQCASAQSPHSTKMNPAAGGHKAIPHSAQRQLKGLTIVKTHNREYTTDSLTLKLLKPDWIASVEVLKDAASIRKYGPAGKQGVTVFTLNDTAHPEAYNMLKKTLKPLSNH